VKKKRKKKVTKNDRRCREKGAQREVGIPSMGCSFGRGISGGERLVNTKQRGKREDEKKRGRKTRDNAKTTRFRSEPFYRAVKGDNSTKEGGEPERGSQGNYFK